MSVAERVRVHDVKLLSDNWYVLKTTRFDFLRRDGQWQTQAARDLRPRQWRGHPAVQPARGARWC